MNGAANQESRNQMTTHILFHAKSIAPFRPCMDGLFAAYAAKLAMPDAVLVPAMYGHPPSLTLAQGDKIYLLDLTYPAPVIEAWADRGVEVVILDHHKQAMEDLSGLSDRIFKSFDIKRSGAVMAWRHFFPYDPVPDFFRYVQDRDLWTKALPSCDLISLGWSEMMHEKSLEECFEVLRMVQPEIDDAENLMEIKALGESAQYEVDMAIAGACDKSTLRLVLGDEVAFFECKTQREFQAYSDIGHALLKCHPTAQYAVVQTGRGWALRSENDRMDVAKIAKVLGGGGHRNAAGCKAELPPSSWFDIRNWWRKKMQ